MGYFLLHLYIKNKIEKLELYYFPGYTIYIG